MKFVLDQKSKIDLNSVAFYEQYIDQTLVIVYMLDQTTVELTDQNDINRFIAEYKANLASNALIIDKEHNKGRKNGKSNSSRESTSTN